MTMNGSHAPGPTCLYCGRTPAHVGIYCRRPIQQDAIDADFLTVATCGCARVPDIHPTHPDRSLHTVLKPRALMDLIVELERREAIDRFDNPE